MPRIVLHTLIQAPIERCFDLARSIDLHVTSQSRHGERAVGGVTTGLIGLGEEVTWEARHFGIQQTLTSRITEYSRPRHFRDVMVRGAFARFEHDHEFETAGSATRMTDICVFEAPLGMLGRWVSRYVLTAHMTRLLEDRARAIVAAAESEEWKSVLDVSDP